MKTDDDVYIDPFAAYTITRYTVSRLTLWSRLMMMCTLISLLPTQSQGTEHCKQADFVIKTDDDVYIILFAAYTITSYNVSIQADFVILTNDGFVTTVVVVVVFY